MLHGISRESFEPCLLEPVLSERSGGSDENHAQAAPGENLAAPQGADAVDAA
jgi:hypothetical protein